jgi:dihydrofolate synthase/folylpolyglutamate synthase
MDFLLSLHKFGSKLGLERIKKLLNLMNDPQDRLRFVHVAGTNGKGSVCAFLNDILIAAGYKMGLYISPHINTIYERIRINNKNIDSESLSNILERIKTISKFMNESLTEFEVITSVAFEYFYINNCDIVILETGLGGRLDATNVVETTDIAVITSIDYDHVEVLGDNLKQIAFEKAGIIKNKCDVVIYPTCLTCHGFFNDVKKVFSDKCNELHIKLYEIDLNDICIKDYNLNGQLFDFEKHKNIKIKLLSDFQIYNAAMAIKTSELLSERGFVINEDSIVSGVANTYWEGRFEILSSNFIIDGAHNTHGVKALVRNLKRYFINKKIIFVVGILRTKNYKEMLAIANTVAYSFVTTQFSDESLSSQELSMYLKKICHSDKHIITTVDVSSGIETALSLQKRVADDIIVCAFGSLYYISEAKKYFNEYVAKDLS